jgi:GTP-binding protein
MKKYPFLRAQFIASAFEEDQFPKTATAREEAMTEIAIVGRSNVGKSSLINSLFKGPKLAKASSTPGKTQSINFFIVDEQLALVDLPGYGYAKVSKEMKEKWSALIEAYLHSRKSLSLILFLIDSRREPTEEDIAFLQWAAHRRIPILLIFTKADKITPREREKQVSLCLAQLEQLNLPPAHFLHYSIKDTRARMELIYQINTLLTQVI